MALGQSQASHLLVAGAEHHAVHPTLRGAAGLTETRGHARQVQQLDDHVFQDVPSPGALFQPLEETTALADAAVVLDQGRQHRCQARVEARELVRRPVFQLAQVQPDLQHLAVGPDIGAAQVIDPQQRDVVLLAHVQPV